ncbi:anaerobic glycerol-3-phosphate dehydrogenase subunit C [Aureliella helgolandensis]|uniref:Anaerobic glycerol-3-phosphate dehydrogenase subunit C n=1 Tax=Aureliella helgolandensis TaxID=2527968 RepID=A0A518GDD6_9BACT|nr:anaerobic glycerol-3-phosphate dehydrogenase subunit C [Aureliella helgolandensis]QDV26609.1 Anaerobic glycerol-3-phosphate dehydrogenase subunit C [Aureliella helgolandensis]
MMESEQIRIQADLRGLLQGDVHCDALYTQLYASDASVYEILPLGVVRPRSTRDVAELLRYCHQHGIPVFPRGGGSGLAGQSLGRGIVVDLSRYMRRVHAPQAGTVRVQCGVVQADLNRSIGYHNLLFGPDPATRSVSSIGSMISVDAAGSHFPRYGSTGDCVESLQVVLSSGEVVELGQHAWAGEDAVGTREGAIAQQVGLLLQQGSALLLRPPWADVSRGCGYRMEKVLDGDRVNLARLMSGSEGTLGIITEATLRVDAIPAVRGLLLLFFDRLDTAAKAALDIARDDVVACDLMDRRLLEIARETESVYATIIPRGAEAMLLVEMQGDEPLSVRNRLMQLLHRLQKRGKPVLSYRLTTDGQERNLLWRLARRVIPRLYRLKGNLRPLPFVEDISVPPKRLPEFLKTVQDVLKAERVTATLFAHALHGQLDVRPFLDLASPKDQIRLATLSETLYEKVMQIGGCVSGEQAFGISRAAWAEKQLGPRLEMCRKIKQVFDPTGILNPGKFLSPTPPKVNENLRPVPLFRQRTNSIVVGGETLQVGNAFEAAAASLGSSQAVDEQLLTGDLNRIAWDETLPVPTQGTQVESAQVQLPVILDWSQGDSVGYTARSCNGCGRCRTSAVAERMCPMFRIHKGEEASPRAKANLLRGVLTGSLEPELLESRELKEISDLCFNCHQCRLECPASVNIPKLVQEAKAQHVASHGLPLSDRLLNRVDLLASLGSRFPRLANWALGNKAMRWLLEKTFGIAHQRKLPKVTRRTFLRWAAREKLNRSGRSAGRKVLYFVDQYVNWHNPMLGRALVEVMRHQNVEVYIPTNQTPSWMAMIAAGDISRARKLVLTNIKVLSEAVRQGYDIITTEPSAALCLIEEYRNLYQNEDTELIAKNTYEASSYLWQMHKQNQLELDFRPMNMSIVYHQPCHAKVLDADSPALNLMRLVPGLQIQFAEHGCSGMAGTFGLQRKNLRTSLRIGRGLVNTMKETHAQMGTTECTACKLQMELLTDKPTVHPVAVLAYAYGTMPQLAAWFSSRNEGNLVN